MPKSRGRATTKRRKKPSAPKSSAPPVTTQDRPDLSALLAAAPRGAARIRPHSVHTKRTAAPAKTDPSAYRRPITASAPPRTASQSQTVVADISDTPSQRRLQVTATGCEVLKDAPHQGLGLTYWFEAAPEGDPYPVSVRFTGTRTSKRGIASEPVKNDTFDVVRTISGVVSGSGLVAITFRILDVAPGEWRVDATPEPPNGPGVPTSRGTPLDRPTDSALSSASGATSYGPLIGAKAPGARIGAWPTLVGLGATVGLTVQALLAENQHLPATRLLILSLVACLMGLFGAKFYYLASHRAEKATRTFSGMSIQGFVLVAITTMIIGALTAAIPLGRMLDVTVPGLLFGMAIGRLGCFFGGCCAGRPTASRWAI